MLQSLAQYAEYHPEAVEEMAAIIRNYILLTGQLLQQLPLGAGNSYAGARPQDIVAPSVLWLIDNNLANGMDEQLLAVAMQTYEQGANWEFLFDYLPTGPVASDNCTLLNHGVNTGMALKSAAVWYRITGNESFVPHSYTRMQNIDMYHGQPTGIFSCDEHLAGTMPSRGTELCTVVEAMYSYSYMFQTHGYVPFADKAETIALNALPAAWADPNNSGTMWNHPYLEQCNEIQSMVENEFIWASDGPDSLVYGLAPNYGCCTANFGQGWPKFASRVFMSTQDDGVAVVFYAPASTTLPEYIGGGATVQTITNYPYDDTVTIVTLSSAAFPLYVRIPGWATNATIYLNEQQLKQPLNGTMYKVNIVDQHSTVTINFNPTIRIEQGYNNSVHIHRGALLFSYPIGTVFNELNYYAFESHDYQIFNATAWNWAIKIGLSNPAEYLSFEQIGYQVGAAPFAKSSLCCRNK